MNKTIHGFSLIEMMIVMLVIAILSSGVIYGFQQWQHHQRLWQTTHQLSQFLHHLRHDANEFNRDHVLTLWQRHDQWCLTTQLYTDKPCVTTSQWQFIPRFKDVSISEITPRTGFLWRDEYRKARAYHFKQCGRAAENYSFSVGAYSYSHTGGENMMQLRQQGFTLIEVLVALALSSVLLLGTMRLFPALQRNILHEYQSASVRESVWLLAYGIGKHLQRAGYCRGICMTPALQIEQSGSRVLIQWQAPDSRNSTG